MNFLFIYETPGLLGGLETLIARMSNWLARRGHRITLLVKNREGLANLLDEEVNCIALGPRFRHLRYYYNAKVILKEFSIPRSDVIKSFDLDSSWIACQIAELGGREPKVIAGMYNPHIFEMKNSKGSLPVWDLDRIILNNFLLKIPADARLFCEREEIRQLRNIYGQNGRLWTLPIDSAQFVPGFRRPKWGKIVSVGRLAPMKEYNFFMIDVVKRLLKKGLDVTWTVYGTGLYESSLRELVRSEGLQHAITFEGDVPYSHFWHVLETTYIFVGMGTAIAEAALFKVPALVAIAYDREGFSYGPVYQMPPGNLGHYEDGMKKSLMIDEIERILSLSSKEYDTEQQLVYDFARGLDMEVSMERFLQFVQEASPISSNYVTYLLNYPFLFIRRMLGLKDRYLCKN